LDIEWKRKDGTLLKVRVSGREVSDDGENDSYEIIVEDITQQRKLEDRLRQQAAKDSLTGLSNYRHLVETVDTEIKRSERTAREFALLFLDMDGLKTINDRFGHVVGSQALCRLADVLCMCSRNLDTAARFGGDEFALVMPETGEAQANLVARRICESLANDGREPKLSVSIGVAIYPKDGEKVETLLSAADAALYLVKVTRGTKRGTSVGGKRTTAEFPHSAAAPAKRGSVHQ
jgi:diguanylate cyclase (GGDEF)-like protein